MRGRRVLIAAVCLVMAGALVAGVFTGVLTSAARAGLTAAGLVSAETPSASRPAVSPRTTGGEGPSPSAPAVTPATPAGLPAAVLPAISSASGTTAALVRKRLAAVSTKDVAGRVGAEVIDLGSGEPVYRLNSGTGLIPASTMKLLTSATALRLLGPDHRFTTTVVQPSKGTVVLVGGGDPYLAKKRDPKRYPARASVVDLATQVSAQLAQQKRRSVAVGYDASLFKGPAWNPVWPTGYGDQVTATSALWVDEGRLAGGSPGPRSADPAADAAKAFATALRSKGVKVTSIRPATATPGVTPIASVASMPLNRIVEQLLMSSDNDAAEVLLRQSGVAAEKEGSIAAGRRAVRDQLSELGVWHDGDRVLDGSGLARQTTVPASTMSQLLAAAAGADHPELRALITGLPVAGVEGSLRHRYDADDTEVGRGWVHGKTGTLRKVHSLAGVVQTADGTLLAYAFLVNDPKNDYAAVVWLEKVTAALAACGCR